MGFETNEGTSEASGSIWSNEGEHGPVIWGAALSFATQELLWPLFFAVIVLHQYSCHLISSSKAGWPPPLLSPVPTFGIVVRFAIR